MSEMLYENTLSYMNVIYGADDKNSPFYTQYKPGCL